MSTSRFSGVTQRTTAWLKANLSAVAALPGPEERWYFEHTDLTESALMTLSSRGCIERVGVDDYDDRRIWQTNAAAYETVQDLLDRLSLLPCGHRPFRTEDLDHDRPYTCFHDDCDARYDRATIEEVTE
jgi:hypothetical protein